MAAENSFDIACKIDMQEVTNALDQARREIETRYDLKGSRNELTLDKTPTNLKPGISARGEIYVDRLHNVLAVPLAALYSEKNAAYVFTRNGDEVKAVAVKVGAVNETEAQIVDGISSADQVLLLEAGEGRECRRIRRR